MFYLPGNHGDATRLWKDELGFRGHLFLILGQDIGFSIAGSWAVGEGEVEPGEE